MPPISSFPIALAMACSALVACGSAVDTPTASYGQAESYTYPSEAETPAVPQQLTVVKPVFKVYLPVTVDDAIAQRVRQIPGVAAAARFAVANTTVMAPAGSSNLTVAAVDPVEFRPLSPDVTAKATFVWRRLLMSELVLAHEEHRQLNLDAGDTAAVLTAGGRKDLKVGAVAANGVPNLAGAMVSLTTGSSIGVGDPRGILIGLAEGADERKVARSIKETLGVKAEKIRPPAGKGFATGGGADKIIGTFSYVANPDGTITQDPAWVKKYIVTRQVPILGKVTCHRALIPQLTQALLEIDRRVLASGIDRSQFGGCYMPRFIGRDSSMPISMHAWGLALDINTVDNPQGAVPKLDPQIVEVFETWGFRWGGRWSPPDGHHFEMAALITG